MLFRGWTLFHETTVHTQSTYIHRCTHTENTHTQHIHLYTISHPSHDSAVGAEPQKGIAVANVACFGQSKFKANYIDTPHTDEL